MASIKITVSLIGARLEGNQLRVRMRIGSRAPTWSTLFEAGVPREDGSIIAPEELPSILLSVCELIEKGEAEMQETIQTTVRGQ